MLQFFDGKDIKVCQIDGMPFESGALKSAFHSRYDVAATVGVNCLRLSAIDGEDFVLNTVLATALAVDKFGSYHGRCVVKGVKADARRYYRSCSDDDVLYAPDLMCSAVARRYATTFNQRTRTSRPVTFVEPRLGTVITGGNSSHLRAGDRLIVEDYIDGAWEKFNDNVGHELRRTETIPAFSHYTYCRSGGRLLVCDVQGVRSADRYHLSDPAVNSVEQLYGPTDLGAVGMAHFFWQHRCTALCERLDLSRPEFVGGDGVGDVVRVVRGRVGGKVLSEDLTPEHVRVNRRYSIIYTTSTTRRGHVLPSVVAGRVL